MDSAKEKAKELVLLFELTDREFRYQDEIDTFTAKKCALIAVENTIKVLESNSNYCTSVIGCQLSDVIYWIEVKNEIEKL